MDKDKIEKIQELKEKRNAIILAHNYQPAVIQDLADITGDSLGLSREAASTDADVIVFCGVHFMAETASILSPAKTVLMPDNKSGCPMADMITAEQLLELKGKHPGALVVSYVNSSAAVKAESDYCCTSANAVEVVESIPKDKEVIFVPDQHLGRHAQEQTGRELILWQGFCPSHILITVEDIKAAREQVPGGVVLTHPECTEPVKEISDELLSTGQMLRFVKQSKKSGFIVATETGMIHALKKVRPDAKFIGASEKAVCPDMKRVTLDKIISSLKDMKYEVKVPDKIRVKAKKAIERMVEVLPVK